MRIRDEVLNRISMIYVRNEEDIRRYLARLHLLSDQERPVHVIVANLYSLYKNTWTSHYCIRSRSRFNAACKEAADWMVSLNPRSTLVVGDSYTDTGTSKEELANLSEAWFDILYLTQQNQETELLQQSSRKRVVLQFLKETRAFKVTAVP